VAKKKRAGTRNEQVIRELMKLKKRRGNPKDYVVLTGASMLDAYETRVVRNRRKNSGEEKVLLIHKRHLHFFIDEQQAAEFWNRKLHIRIPRKQVTTSDPN